MYLSLLATEMDSRARDGSHPGFVEIVRQLSAVEARLLPHFLPEESDDTKVVTDGYGNWSLAHPSVEQINVYLGQQMLSADQCITCIDNWIRLGLMRVDDDGIAAMQRLEEYISREVRRVEETIRYARGPAIGAVHTPLSQNQRNLYITKTRLGVAFATAAGIKQSTGNSSSGG